jgi:hypothetical protein
MSDPTLAERVAAIGKDAANRMERQHIAREWWEVRRPGAEPFEVFMCPPATHLEMLARYPGCGILPITRT